MDDVGKFIKRFQNPENNKIFADDCSYWFAVILYLRFIRDSAKIMFDVDKNCFGTMVYERVYNVTGDVTENGKWVPWIELQDKSLKEGVTNKYIMF